MDGFVQSFNLRVSVALCLYHLHHVLKFLKKEGNMSSEEIEQLKCKLLLKNCFIEQNNDKEKTIVGLVEILTKYKIECNVNKIKDIIK